MNPRGCSGLLRYMLLQDSALWCANMLYRYHCIVPCGLICALAVILGEILLSMCDTVHSSCLPIAHPCTNVLIIQLFLRLTT
jgi:hypothetical protein